MVRDRLPEAHGRTRRNLCSSPSGAGDLFFFETPTQFSFSSPRARFRPQKHFRTSPLNMLAGIDSGALSERVERSDAEKQVRTIIKKDPDSWNAHGLLGWIAICRAGSEFGSKRPRREAFLKRFRAPDSERFDGSGTTGYFSRPRPPISILTGC